nr:hypothetical protein GCM10020092_068980 [Actinoplanes digitatis]
MKVWTGDTEPPDQPGTHGGSVAYRSSLTLSFDPPPRATWPGRGRRGFWRSRGGRIEVEGLGVVKEAKLYPGGGREWDWSETGTRHSPGIQPADVEEILLHGATAVVLSRGMDLRLQVGPARARVSRAAGRRGACRRDEGSGADLHGAGGGTAGRRAVPFDLLRS